MRENGFLKNNIPLEFTIIEILCGAIVIAQYLFSLSRALEVYRNRSIEIGNNINYTRTQYKSLNKNKIRTIASTIDLGETLQFHSKITNFHNKENVIFCFTSFDSLRNTEYVLKKIRVVTYASLFSNYVGNLLFPSSFKASIVDSVYLARNIM